MCSVDLRSPSSLDLSSGTLGLKSGLCRCSVDQASERKTGAKSTEEWFHSGSWRKAAGLKV